MENRRKSDRGYRDLAYVIGRSSPPKLSIALAISASLVGVVATIFFPIMTKFLIDKISTQQSFLAGIFSNSALYLMLIFILVSAVSTGVSNYLLGMAGIRMINNLKSILFSTIVRRDIPWMDQHESGELVSRLANDTQVISRLMTKELSGLFSGLLLLIGSAVALCFIDIKLTIVIFSIVFVSFILMLPVVVRMGSITRAINDATAQLSAHMTRVFGESRLVKAFTAEDAETVTMNKLLDQMKKRTSRTIAVESILTPVSGLSLTFAMIAILLYGGIRVQQGSLSVGSLTAFILYIFNVAGPFLQLSSFASQLQASRGASERIVEQLNADLEERNDNFTVPSLSARPDTSSDITFEGVTFSYSLGAPPLLSIENLTFPTGSKTAIVGPSGAGKTTIFSLLERFYEPSTGRITYGGADIRSFAVGDWRRKIGYVPQSATLMRGSVRENVAYGSPKAPDEEAIMAALAATNCLDFVHGLKDGLDTDIGENGVLLSGGQRQRLAIARTFYRDPEILLLDEITSSLDSDNEMAILLAIESLTNNRTCILITHRETSILPSFDRILLTDGRVQTDIAV